MKKSYVLYFATIIVSLFGVGFISIPSASAAIDSTSTIGWYFGGSDTQTSILTIGDHPDRKLVLSFTSVGSLGVTPDFICGFGSASTTYADITHNFVGDYFNIMTLVVMDAPDVGTHTLTCTTPTAAGDNLQYTAVSVVSLYNIASQLATIGNGSFTSEHAYTVTGCSDSQPCDILDWTTSYSSAYDYAASSTLYSTSERYFMNDIVTPPGFHETGASGVYATTTTDGDKYFAYLGSMIYITLGFREDASSVTQLSLSNLAQLKSDGVTPIDEGATTAEDTVVFGATLNSSSTDSLQLEVEHTASTTFTATSSPVNPGSSAVITVQNLPNGSYHWRARAVDTVTHARSDWQEFGIPGNTDFVVDNLGQAAAGLVKQLINQNYLYGGKGWDVHDKQFVSINKVETDYYYWKDDGSVDHSNGVDCSGLVAWSYNHSYDQNKFFDKNYIGKPDANAQYVYNMQSTSTATSTLKTGDLLFFDSQTYHPATKTWTSGPDGIMDHVAMYVGDQGGYDVVEARSPTVGIATSSVVTAKARTGFVAFGNPKNFVAAMSINKTSPVHLSVTDPDGNTISDSTGIASDEEFIRELSDLTYATKGIDAGGYPEDVVYSPILKQGSYLIRITPMASTTSSQTYSLDFTAGSTTINLAQNVPLSQIPSQGYGVAISSSDTTSVFIPVAIDIKPGSYPNSINLGSNGVVPVAIFGSATFDVHQINSASTTLANAAIKLKGNGQPLVSYSDINGDGFTDATVQFLTDALQLTSSDVTAELDGFLTTGTEIKGSDSIRIVPQ